VLIVLRAIHKRRQQSRRMGFVQFGHFADQGSSSDADVHTFWCKILDFCN